jgi:hypothetical protein
VRVALKSGALSGALAAFESSSSFESFSGEAEAAIDLRPANVPTTATIAAIPRMKTIHIRP